MKKRLFITSALMTAVMAASLATGTYAWYTATATGGLKFSTDIKESVSTKNETTIAEKVIAVEFTDIPALELTDETGRTYVYNQQGLKVEVNVLKENKLNKCTFTFDKASEGKPSFFDGSVAAAIYDGNYTITLKSTDQVKINSADDTYTDKKSLEYALTISGGRVTKIGDKVKGAEQTEVTDKTIDFYVSVAPKQSNAVESFTSGTSYGEIHAEIAPAAASSAA